MIEMVVCDLGEISEPPLTSEHYLIKLHPQGINNKLLYDLDVMWLPLSSWAAGLRDSLVMDLNCGSVTGSAFMVGFDLNHPYVFHWDLNKKTKTTPFVHLCFWSQSPPQEAD